jgi:hypothetical protein
VGTFFRWAGLLHLRHTVKHVGALVAGQHRRFSAADRFDLG